jgi:hypothetical protein
MTRSACILAVLAIAAPAAAQRAHPVTELTDEVLESQLGAQRSAVEGCASRTTTSAFLVEVDARVSPGPRPSSTYNARIRVRARSRPRDHAYESCVRRAVWDALRNTPFAVHERARARRTFQLSERPDPPPPPPAVPYRPQEVAHALRRHDRILQSCLSAAGVGEPVVLRIAVEPTGRLILMHAQLPPRAGARALSCLQREVSRVAIEGRPGRRTEVTHTLNARAR